MNKNYDDLINREHPTSKKHRRMSMMARAAQFAPFAALTGHDAAIRETARTTQNRLELSEDEKAALDRTLMTIKNCTDVAVTVKITYFCPDEKKAGGRYESVKGEIKKIDAHHRTIILCDNTQILIDDIYDIEII